MRQKCKWCDYYGLQLKENTLLQWYLAFLKVGIVLTPFSFRGSLRSFSKTMLHQQVEGLKLYYSPQSTAIYSYIWTVFFFSFFGLFWFTVSEIMFDMLFYSFIILFLMYFFYLYDCCKALWIVQYDKYNLIIFWPKLKVSNQYYSIIYFLKCQPFSRGL